MYLPMPPPSSADAVIPGSSAAQDLNGDENADSEHALGHPRRSSAAMTKLPRLSQMPVEGSLESEESQQVHVVGGPSSGFGRGVCWSGGGCPHVIESLGPAQVEDTRLFERQEYFRKVVAVWL